MIRKVIALAAVLASTLLIAPATSAHAAVSSPAVGIVVSTAVPAAQSSVAAPAIVAAATSYVVVSGDTLSGIAARFCGRASAYPTLAARSGIADADLIYPGQRVDVSTCAGPAAVSAPVVTTASPAALSSSGVEAVIAYARAQLGKPYRWAAAGPDAFDCSGLVMAAYSIVGVRLPHFTGTMINYGTPVSRSNLRPGDAIWPYSSLGHVVLYIGDGQIIEAPQAGQRVSIRNLYGFYAARRYL